MHIGHTFFGAGNFGDDLVLAGFLKGTAGAMPGLRITCATAFDRDSQRRRFPNIEWSAYDPASCQPLIAACDVWVGLGASIFQETDDSWLLADQLLQLEACRRYGKPVFFLGSGVDYRIDAQRPEIRALLDAASWIWTRDTLSTTALQRMGFDRVTTAADLSHLAMQEMPPVQIASGTTGFVCNFERETDYSIESLASLIEAAANSSRAVAWLVQEIRMLPGSEFDIYHRLPARTRRLMALRQPNYSTNSISELVGNWDGSDRLFSTRFHGAIIGAWSGSRVVVFERQKKLRGLSEDLGIVSFPSMPGPDELARAFDRAQPVPRSVLSMAARLAEKACIAFLEAAATAIQPLYKSRLRTKGKTTMSHLPQPLVECHSLDGVAHVGLGRIGPGLKRGEIFVVRGCLQAIGALEPLRTMILNTLEQVAGHQARIKAEAQGLTRIHEFVPIEQLAEMNPLMKQRARLLAPDIVADLTGLLPGLGPDVHFEDTPNVRIFIPHDVSSRHETELKAYIGRRGYGGELTLQPPHQDSRHFHPIGAINVWCAIDQVVEANGMSVFPAFYGHHLPFTDADGGIRPDQYLGPSVSMDLSPGDAWIFETIHIHGSTINQTDQTRFVISFRVTPDIPSYRDKPWYNYVRPIDCLPDGPPATTIDYTQPPPDRGPVTIDTSGKMPSPLVSSTASNGEIKVAGQLVLDGEIRAISRDLCIARIDGKPIAFARRCPHQGADLAGGTIRNSRIVCAWHGLRINTADGRTGSSTFPALGLARAEEQDGIITISALPQATDRSALRAPADPHAEAIAHFARAADRFHAALQIYNEAHGQWGLATLCHARTASVYALLGLPGNVIRDRLEAPASRLISSMLGSDDRRVARTAEEETTFIECWRRLGQCWNEEVCFGYGLASLALSRHGFELIGLEPLTKDLGWTEPLWIRCLLEAMPAGAQPENSDLAPDILPPLMAQVRDRLCRLDPVTKDELFKARDAVVSYVQPNSLVSGPEADTASLHRQIETLTGHLKEANADRELSHQNIHTLAAHLKEANADRELSHQNIHTLAAHLKEANADRELSHQNIHTLAGHLQEANASLEAIKNGHGFIAVSRVSAVLARVFSRHADRT